MALFRFCCESHGHRTGESLCERDDEASQLGCKPSKSAPYRRVRSAHHAVRHDFLSSRLHLAVPVIHASCLAIPEDVLISRCSSVRLRAEATVVALGRRTCVIAGRKLEISDIAGRVLDETRALVVRDGQARPREQSCDVDRAAVGSAIESRTRRPDIRLVGRIQAGVGGTADAMRIIVGLGGAVSWRAPRDVGPLNGLHRNVCATWECEFGAGTGGRMIRLIRRAIHAIPGVARANGARFQFQFERTVSHSFLLVGECRCVTRSGSLKPSHAHLHGLRDRALYQRSERVSTPSMKDPEGTGAATKMAVFIQAKI